MSEYVFATIESLQSKQRDVIEKGNLKEGAVFFSRYRSGYILSFILAVLFALAGIFALDQMLSMPHKFAGSQSNTRYFFAAIFLLLGMVAFLASFIFLRSGWRNLKISRKQKSGRFDYGLRLDATGLLARPAMKDKPLSCIYVPLEDIDGVEWEAKGRTVSGDRYRTIDHYVRMDLKHQLQAYLYLNSFAGNGIDLVAEIKRWVESR